MYHSHPLNINLVLKVERNETAGAKPSQMSTPGNRAECHQAINFQSSLSTSIASSPIKSCITNPGIKLGNLLLHGSPYNPNQSDPTNFRRKHSRKLVTHQKPSSFQGTTHLPLALDEKNMVRNFIKHFARTIRIVNRTPFLMWDSLKQCFFYIPV